VEKSTSLLFIDMGDLFICLTNTPSASLNYCVSIVNIPSNKLIELENKTKFDAMCVSGCPNYEKKWSCPPFAPEYHQYMGEWIYLYIFYIQIKMDQFKYIKSDYLKIKAANSILKSKADNYLRKMTSNNEKYISTGSCRLCKPCKCKNGLPCTYPEKKTFSYEAMGIDVGTIVELYFKSKLLWYRRGELPEYTSIVCGILSNNVYSLETLRDKYNKLIEIENENKRRKK
jgi:predicted metal-binding protein